MGWPRLLWRSARVPAEPRGGASSFHLWWHGVDAVLPIVEVRATLEVVTCPSVPRLYFWALQASFLDEARSYGAAHVGLQWNPRHAGSTAVNWGGYADAGNVQSILTGTASALPSTPDDPNTRDYPWSPGVPYRFRITRGHEGWLGEVADLASGAAVAIRELHAPGDRLANMVVWAEVFAGCLDPSTRARWSGFEAVDLAGMVHTPRSVSLTFPDVGDCPNTDVVADGAGFVLVTNTTRRAYAGQALPCPPR